MSSPVSIDEARGRTARAVVPDASGGATAGGVQPACPTCRVCGDASSLFDAATVLQRHAVRYYRCGACGFIFTEAPYWLDEAYSSAMTSIDIGPVARCFEGAQKIAALILAAHDHRGRFLDFGGGYGLFCRRMRDLGFDFLHYDTHCENIFAKQHAFRMEEGGRFEVVTAFEVVEHLTEPMTVFELILSMTDSFCISTVLVPDPAPRVTKWWYYGPEHGQHIAFYTKESLRHIAERFGCHLHSVGDMHLLTRRSVSPRSFRWAMDARLARLMTALLGRRKGVHSLLQRDFESLSGHRLP